MQLVFFNRYRQLKCDLRLSMFRVYKKISKNDETYDFYFNIQSIVGYEIECRMTVSKDNASVVAFTKVQLYFPT